MPILNIKTGQSSDSLLASWNTGNTEDTFRPLPYKGYGIYNMNFCTSYYIIFYGLFFNGSCPLITEAQHGSQPSPDVSVAGISIEGISKKLIRN